MNNNENELPEELCEYFQKISENNPVEYLAKMIAPHLVGGEWEMIRKTTLLSLASFAMQKSKRKRRIHTLLLGGPGTGKSVDGETQVIIRVDEEIKIVKIKDTEQLGQFDTLSINTSTLENEWKPVYKVTKHTENRKLLKVTTIGQQEVKATVDHSFLRFDFESDQLVPLLGKNLKKGDLIPFISNIPIDNENDGIEFIQKTIGIGELAKELHIDWRRIKFIFPFENYERTGTRWEIPIDDVKRVYKLKERDSIKYAFNYQLGFLIGFWLADGDINGNYIRFSNKDRGVLKSIKETLSMLKVPKTSTTYNGGCFYKSRTTNGVQVGNPLLLELLMQFVSSDFHKLKGKGKSCHTKFIPSFCFASNSEFRRGLLCGYFTGDGTVDRGLLYATTSSKELAQGISLLLKCEGIGCHVKKRRDKYFDINIPSYFHLKFSNEIGFMGVKQKRLLKKIRKTRFNSSIVVVPIPHPERNKRYMTKNKALKYVSLDKLVKSNVYWTPIKSIEEVDGDGFVYDFSVEDNENFILANGMAVHNTELLLWWQNNLGGVMVNSENTSKTGLVGDARGGEITPGLLVELDGNFVLLDELDKMSMNDQNGLLQAMEEGSYKIIKGKHRKRFQAEIRAIASANEVKKIQLPLLDRFDFIYHCTTSTRDDRAKNVPKITESFFSDDDEKIASILNGYMIWLGDTTPSAFSDKKTSDAYIANYIRKVKEVDVPRASYRFLEMSILRTAWAIAKLHKREVVTPKDVEDAIVFKHDTMRRIYGINIKKGKSDG